MTTYSAVPFRALPGLVEVTNGGASITVQDILDGMNADPPAVNVTQVKGATIADLDASGNVLAKLAGGVTHGGSTAELSLKKVEIVNNDQYGTALSLRGGNFGSPGTAIELIHGDGTLGTGIIKGYVQGVVEGVPLSTEAIHDISFDATGLNAIANAVNNLAPTGTPAVGSIGSHLDAILNGLTGVGLLPLIYTVTVTGTATPIEGVTVEVYTEEACINCVRRGTTNSFGIVIFWFTTPGTYWLKCAKDGYAFPLDSEVVAV